MFWVVTTCSSWAWIDLSAESCASCTVLHMAKSPGIEPIHYQTAALDYEGHLRHAKAAINRIQARNDRPTDDEGQRNYDNACDRHTAWVHLFELSKQGHSCEQMAKDGGLPVMLVCEIVPNPWTGHKVRKTAAEKAAWVAEYHAKRKADGESPASES